VNDLISLADVSPEQWQELLDLAVALKTDLRNQGPNDLMRGKLLGLIFEKASTRTRFSFEAAMSEMGGCAVFVDTQGKALAAREPVRDLARVYAGYCAGLVLRTYNHETIVEMARYAEIPVINGLSDYLHPCQALADLLTLREHFGQLRGLTVAYVGDSNNVARSLAYACGLAGAQLRVASPPQYRFAPTFGATVQPTEALVETDDPREAVRGADAVYTDVWTSMGQEEEALKRRQDLADYQVNAALMGLASDNAVFLHCLPAHRDEEVTDEVIEGPQSLVFQQAENRKHAQKAVLKLLLG
jgi:ornithine carbamoyltransferase